MRQKDVGEEISKGSFLCLHFLASMFLPQDWGSGLVRFSPGWSRMVRCGIRRNTRNAKAGNLYQNLTFSLPKICFWPIIRTRAFPEAGKGPAQGAEFNEVLDRLWRRHTQSVFERGYQRGLDKYGTT
jgi:hypothetical protein